MTNGKRSRLIGCILVLFAMAGCGGGTGSVSGEVTFEGMPIPVGRVTFFCDSGDRPVLTAAIENGSYTFPKVPVGPARITVETFAGTEEPRRQDLSPELQKVWDEYKKKGDTKESRAQVPAGMAVLPPGEWLPVPPQYADAKKSGLTYTVIKGTQEYNIPLKAEMAGQ